MLCFEDLRDLHTNQRLLVLELQRRNVEVRLLDRKLQLLEASYGCQRELILDRDSSIMPYPASVISGNKFVTKCLLREAGMSVVDGDIFYSYESDDALVYAQRLGFPVVVKPNFGSHGYDVHMDLKNLCDVQEAIEEVVKSIGDAVFLVEEQAEGKEYRVFITRNKDYAVLHRDPAHVIGDGEKTIEELADVESKKRNEPITLERNELFPRRDCLCPILLDDEAKRHVARNGNDFKFVPKDGEKVYVRNNSNVAMGATCEDYTDQIHPSVIDISRRVLDVFPSMPYAGIDFMSKDIRAVQTPDLYRIIEVNSVPGIHMHMRPNKGRSRDVASFIVDMMFPETKK